jgi:hypothetical protein
MTIGRGTEVLGENLPQCLFIRHKSQIWWPEIEHVPQWWQVGD